MRFDDRTTFAPSLYDMAALLPMFQKKMIDLPSKTKSCISDSSIETIIPALIYSNYETGNRDIHEEHGIQRQGLSLG